MEDSTTLEQLERELADIEAIGDRLIKEVNALEARFTTPDGLLVKSGKRKGQPLTLRAQAQLARRLRSTANAWGLADARQFEAYKRLRDARARVVEGRAHAQN